MFTSLHSCRLYKEWNSIVRSDGQGKKNAVGTKHSCYAGKQIIILSNLLVSLWMLKYLSQVIV